MLLFLSLREKYTTEYTFQMAVSEMGFQRQNEDEHFTSSLSALSYPGEGCVESVCFHKVGFSGDYTRLNISHKTDLPYF